MKIEFLALPEKTFLDFYDAFVPQKEELEVMMTPERAVCFEAGRDFDEWYYNAFLFERLSPDLPVLSMEDALKLLENMEGKVLFLSEPLQKGPLGGGDGEGQDLLRLRCYGRPKGTVGADPLAV